jgi:ClpP class serine protease
MMWLFTFLPAMRGIIFCPLATQLFLMQVDLMDVKTGLSILNKQWLIEPSAALQMLELWERSLNGEIKWSYQKIRAEEGEREQLTPYQLYQKFFASSDIIMAPESSWDMEDFNGFEGASVAVIPVTGPLMKDDFCGSFGTKTMRYLTNMATKAASVKSIVYLIDSPGGTVDGNEAFADAIKSSSKRTIAVVDGYMCSAAYWLGCSCDEVYAGSQTDIIGSIGTMCAFQDASKALEARGIVLREFYATASTEKNAAHREAMKGDGKKLIQQTLDPLNNVFLSTVKANRGSKLNLEQENVLNGRTYTSHDALAAGLIDGIKSLDVVLGEAKTGKKITSQTTINHSSNKKNMTANEFKAAHPEAYNEIYNAGMTAGVKQEKSRIGAWLKFQSVDAETVAKGIKEDLEVDMGVIADMSVKAMSGSTAEAMKKDNPKDVTTTPPQNQPTKEQAEKSEFLNACMDDMGIKA